MNRILFFAVVIAMLFMNNCAKNVNHSEGGDGGIDTTQYAGLAYGTDSTVEILTWNLENFPIEGGDIEGMPDPGREEYFKNIFKYLKVDLIAVEEVNYANNLIKIIEEFPEYGISMTPENVTQKTGFIYHKGVFAIQPGRTPQVLFPEEDYIFPRLPYLLPVECEMGGKTLNIDLIVLHLKASQDSKSKERRRQAINKLYDYARTNVINANVNYVILGDYNSDVDSETYLTTTFVADTLFSVLSVDSLEINESYYATYPGYTSIIDHIVVSKNLLNQIQLLDVETLRIDDTLRDYLYLMSDHRPVGMKFK
ncbi:MAG: hypothetical protein Kow00108_17840 [Calditrichia bacterium]